MKNHTAEFNNFGVTLLQNGELEMSRNVFRQALHSSWRQMEKTELQLSPDKQADKPATAQVSFGNDCGLGESCSTSAWTVKEMEYSCLSQTEESASNTFLHTRGINVSDMPCFTARDGFINDAIASSIILFNLGLVYHLKGNQSHPSIYLPQAESLYIKSLAVLTEIKIDVGSTGDGIVDLLPMAILNNLAQVSRESSNYKQSGFYLEKLKKIAFNVKPASYRDTTTSTLMARQRRFFLLNVIVLQDPKPAAAA